MSFEGILKNFNDYDKDGSGFLSRDEASALLKNVCGAQDMTEDAIDDAINWIDGPAGDGKISKSELICAVHPIGRVFRDWDKDGCGYIERSELSEVLKRDKSKKFSEDELKRAFELVDGPDGDGRITFREFAKSVFGVDVPE